MMLRLDRLFFRLSQFNFFFTLLFFLLKFFFLLYFFFWMFAMDGTICWDLRWRHGSDDGVVLDAVTVSAACRLPQPRETEYKSEANFCGNNISNGDENIVKAFCRKLARFGQSKIEMKRKKWQEKQKMKRNGTNDENVLIRCKIDLKKHFRKMLLIWTWICLGYSAGWRPRATCFLVCLNFKE